MNTSLFDFDILNVVILGQIVLNVNRTISPNISLRLVIGNEITDSGLTGR